MKQPILTNHIDELVVKQEKWINLILGFPMLSLFAIAIFFGEELGPFFKGNIIASISFAMVYLGILYFLIRGVLDNSVKMLINSEGIWVKKKGLLAWGNIHYYYFEEIESDVENSTFLKIKLIDRDKEVKISMNSFNVSEQAIDIAIEKNSGTHKIIALKEMYLGVIYSFNYGR